jgi:hypothetical protein
MQPRPTGKGGARRPKPILRGDAWERVRLTKFYHRQSDLTCDPESHSEVRGAAYPLSAPSPDPPGAVTSLNGAPLAGPVLEPPTPVREIGTVLDVPGPVLSVDQAEVALGLEREGLAVVRPMWSSLASRP